jgi:hypothetical protein
MREQSEAVLASMGDMLAASNRSFGQTAKDLRATAHQVVEDIENARSELKRTILDLPDETRTNADAMRRVVSDQITALTALSDVVKRQSGLMELSGPGVHYPPPNGGSRGNGGPSPGKSEGAPSTAPHTRTAGAQEKISQRSNGPEDSVEAAKLARRTERLVSKLNGLARDLVEVLDSGLDEELEARFGAGEEHVYTHRLYLARGKLQPEIGARYGAEQPVRERTNLYLQLFERLLERVAQAPQGQELVDACLASESGKVYLMLAQASGRVATE